jgi:hypothetical protein
MTMISRFFCCPRESGDPVNADRAFSTLLLQHMSLGYRVPAFAGTTPECVGMDGGNS